MNTRINGDMCRQPADMMSREWLDTNGTGSYASSTLLLAHTRRYHGLLVANLPGPAHGRHVLLSKFEESVDTSQGETFLTRHQYPGVLYPPAPLSLVEFELSECPSWRYGLPGCELRRSVMMLHRRNAVLVRYSLFDATAPATLRLKPFLAFRRNHTLMRENRALRPDVQPLVHGLSVDPYPGMPRLYLHWSAGRVLGVKPGGDWYRQFEYAEEHRRGYDFREDLYMPAVLELALAPDQDLFVAASIEPLSDSLDALWLQEASRRADARQSALRHCRKLTRNAAQIAVAERLAQAADQFLVTMPGHRPAVIAGYHWFDDWGRDTMIALPGLAFCCGRLEDGFRVLQTFSERERHGFLPNVIAPDGTCAYNGVDASLWFFWTVQQYLRAGGSLDDVREHLWPTMRRILDAYAAGSTNRLVCNADGLLSAGGRDTQLTWMDASVNGLPVTPRWGYAVEINALWFNALLFCDELAKIFRDRTFRLPVAVTPLTRAFRRMFWLPDAGHLADVVNETGTDRALRPNQIFAVSLPFSPLTHAMQEAVVAAVARELRTPFGLRTLAPSDPHYRATYSGDVLVRDFAYHQGTVWPWLLGAFVESHLKIHRHSVTARDEVRQWLAPWREHLADAGVGTISEVGDGDAPHRPNGCIAQAWSVAEILRAHHLLWEADRKGTK